MAEIVLITEDDAFATARSLISAISLAAPSLVVAISCEAWPGSDAAGAWRRLGADAVLPKPSGPASPTLAGGDRDAFAGWFADLINGPPEGTT